MKSIAVKVLIGTLVAGTVATGVVFANFEDNYESYLRKQGRELLTSGSDKWNTLKTKYSKEGDGLLITIEDKPVQKTDLQPEQLKEWCLANNKGKFTNTKDEIYQRVSAWCTEPKTIVEKIGLENILDDTEPATPSGTGVAQTLNQALWTRKAQNYNTEGNTILIKQINNSSAEGTEDIRVSAATEAILRAWCRFSKNKHFKHEEDARYKAYLSWCTK
ncbi:hypothetical protein A6V39_00940 [Candidatus Mycoplasma haematobovis]|uniref:Uncharacterized protein n=1 Tax=Candidatus Mycoplasma haematobovis TaxID=432608 RepID=A0A1A9QEF1_9MOLU|nr:hypothetical protein [Candidatus Mycoplasma haematobovis]OAL10618.1 hypothetical protein A6V39_00940 [Candidatus Mycoplasma haematobovis]